MSPWVSAVIRLLYGYGVLSFIDLIKGTCHAESPSAEYDRIKYMSTRLEKAFSQLARDEMGVMALQAAFDNIDYRARPKLKSETRLKGLVAKFSRRLMDYTNLVTGTRASVTRLYEAHKQSPLAPRFECCNLSERDLSHDPTYGCRVSRRKCCDLIPRSLPLTSFNPGHNLTNRFQKLLDYWNHVKWFYFITADGLHSEFPAHNFFHSNLGGLSDVLPVERRPHNRKELPSAHSYTPISSVYGHDPEAWQPQSLPNIYTCHALHNLRHRDTFVRSVVPAPIWLTIVVDQGQASQTQMLLGHRVAQLLVASLSEKDLVAVLLASDSIHSAFNRTGVNNSSRTSEYGTFQPAVSSSKDDPRGLRLNNSAQSGGAMHRDRVHWDSVTSLSVLMTSRKIVQRGTFFILQLLNTLLADVHRPMHVKTNHTLALVSAFKVIRTGLAENRLPSTLDVNGSYRGPHLLLAYISRGYLNELGESAEILRAVSHQQMQLPDGHRIVINAYMTVEEKSSTDQKERSFMTNLARRWNMYSNAEDEVESSTVRPGHFFEINRTTDFSNTVGRFYELFNYPHTQNLNISLRKANNGMKDTLGINTSTADPQGSLPEHLNPPVQYSLPYHDLEGSGGLVVSISQAFYDRNLLIGVMGIDVHVADLFDNFIHFTDGAEAGGAGSSIAFLVHAPDGYALMHPTVASDPRLSLPVASDWLKMTLSGRSRNGLGSMPESIRPRDFGSSSTQSAWYSAPEPGISVQRKNTANLKSSAANLFPHVKSPLTGEFSVSSALHLDIAELEVLPGFVEHVRKPLLSRTSGSVVLPVHLVTPQMAEVYDLVGTVDTCTSNFTGNHSFRVVYTWRRVLFPSTPFVVVLRSVETSCAEQHHLTPLVPEFEFHYHRLDLLKLSHTCLYLRQLATFDFGTIYLAPKAFSRPFARLRQTSTDTTENLNDVRHLMAYLLDHTMLISNPGLNELTRPSIRSSVAVVERIGKFWAHRFRVGNLRHSIIRRYVATDTGVMLIYPGTLMPETFDPTVRTWYRRALAAPGHIVATGPYLDERGVGHIITLSRTIFEGNATGIHDASRDKVSAVIAIDVSYLLIRHLLSVWLPECSGDPGENDKSVDLSGQPFSGEGDKEAVWVSGDKSSLAEARQRCLLMDDRSYLMEHPRWGTMPEHNHLHYHEPIVAADLLKNHKVMEKKTCIHYPSRSVQRYYQLRTDEFGPDDVIENVLPKANLCVTYQFIRVQHTNLYIGLISKHHRVGCTPRTAFCPCSAIGRRCFNCIRLEPTECECPCECPLPSDVGIPGWVDAVRRVGANSSHPFVEYSPCPALIELQASHPIPIMSLVASMASLTGRKNALPVCQLNSDYRETATSFMAPEPSLFSMTGDFELTGEVAGEQSPTHLEQHLLGLPRFLHLAQPGTTHGDNKDMGQRCWELDRLACSTTDHRCKWCRLRDRRQRNNRSLEYWCLPTFSCTQGNSRDSPNVRLPDGQNQSTLNDWSLSSSFEWHSNIQHKADQRSPQVSPSREYHQDEYAYRLVEWRSRLISPGRKSALGSHNAWWFDPGRAGGADPPGDSSVDTSRLQLGPVAGALLAIFTVLLLLMLVYLAHRRRRLNTSVVEAEDNTTLQMVLASGLTGSCNKKPIPDDKNDGDAGNGGPPAYPPPSPRPGGGSVAVTTDDSTMVPLLVLLESASVNREVTKTAASSTLAQGSDTDSSLVGRSFKSVVSTTSSASSSSKTSSSGVTGSLSAFAMKSGRRRHRPGVLSGQEQKKNSRPEFDSLLESDGQTERGDVAVCVTNSSSVSVHNHVYRLPIILRPKQQLQHCASEPESAVGSDCPSNSSTTSSSAVSATLLATVRLKTATRVRQLLTVDDRRKRHDAGGN